MFENQRTYFELKLRYLAGILSIVLIAHLFFKLYYLPDIAEKVMRIFAFKALHYLAQ